MRLDSSSLASSSTLDMAATPSRASASEAVRDPAAPVCRNCSPNDPKNRYSAIFSPRLGMTSPRLV